MFQGRGLRATPPLRVWSSGRASAFQAGERGSTPLTRSIPAPEAEADEARSCNLRLRGFESLLVLHLPEERFDLRPP